MQFRVLGELEIRTRDGVPVALPAGRALNVLAALMMRPNRSISVEELLMFGWGAPDVSPAQLHKTTSALRKILALAGGTGRLVTHSRFGYELRIADDNLDLLDFQRLLEDSDRARAEDRAHDEIELLHRALGLWRGPRPLANVRADWVEQATAPMVQRRNRLIVRLLELHTNRGDPQTLVDVLPHLGAESPADGLLLKVLMIALYRTGQTTEALEVYKRYKRMVVADTAEDGRDAGLLALSHAIATGDEQAIASAVPVSSRRRSGRFRSVPRQLPAQLAGFLARDEELRELAGLLNRPRSSAVVISGARGIGKTALALQAAHAGNDTYPDGQLWLNLHGSGPTPTSPGDALGQMLRALDIEAIPDVVDERAAMFRTLAADRRFLLVLDDAADEAQIEQLIPASSLAAVLVTSRRRLPELAGAHHLALTPLEEDDAVALFKAVAAASRVELRNEDDAIRDVVRLCQGNPLAVRVAAAQRVHSDPRPTAEIFQQIGTRGLATIEPGDEHAVREAFRLQPGSILVGRYRLVETLGGGRSGAMVWRAYDDQLGQSVVVKVMRTPISEESALLQRLEEESQNLTDPNSPGDIVAANSAEVERPNGVPVSYIVTEPVDGESLATVLARARRLPWSEANEILVGLSASLAAMHARGIVHRDLSPANVLLTPGGATVIDLGVAARNDETEPRPDSVPLEYIAPERLGGEEASQATDVYALGLMIYRTVAGELPWDDNTIATMLRTNQYSEPKPLPSSVQLPASIRVLANRCLRRRPADRPSSADLAQALRVLSIRESTANALFESVNAIEGTSVQVSSLSAPASDASTSLSPAQLDLIQQLGDQFPHWPARMIHNSIRRIRHDISLGDVEEVLRNRHGRTEAGLDEGR